MCRVPLAHQCLFLFACFEGLYAGHPYIHLISFEIFNNNNGEAQGEGMNKQK